MMLRLLPRVSYLTPERTRRQLRLLALLITLLVMPLLLLGLLVMSLVQRVWSTMLGDVHWLLLYLLYQDKRQRAGYPIT